MDCTTYEALESGMMIPLQVPSVIASHSFKVVRNRFRPSTVSPSRDKANVRLGRENKKRIHGGRAAQIQHAVHLRGP